MRRDTVCILHEARERLLARRLAADLAAHGISARADLGALEPGETISDWSRRGVGGASVLLVLVSQMARGPHDLPDGDVSSGTERAPGDWRVIVARLSAAPIPPGLARARVIDFTDYETGLAALVASL